MKRCKMFYATIIICFVILTINFVMNLAEQIDYEKRKDSGNERWKQVEERITNIEKRVGVLENGRNDSVDN